MRIPGAAVIAVAAALALAPSAAADSIVFVGRDGNVWIANPDGSAQHRVTSDGTPSSPYESPSQSDAGVIVAARGSGFGARLYRMRQDGELLNPPIPTPVPPFSPKVSPNGALVAYYTLAAVAYPDCAYCIGTYDQALYTHPDRLTPYESLPMPHCCEDPSWMGNAGVLLTNGSPTVWYHPLGSPEALEWFADGDTGAAEMEGLHDAELSPAGDRIVAVRGFEPETLAFYQTSGPPPATPAIRCEISGAAPRPGLDYRSPTWSPDGRSVAWEEAGGVVVAAMPDLGACSAGGAPRLVFPGATDPDWSPAPNAPPAPARDVTAPRVTLGRVRARLAGALRRGLVVRVACSEPCSLGARLELRGGGRVVARGSATLREAGRGALRLRFTRRARRALRHAGALRGTLRVSAADAAGNRAAARRSLELRR